MKRAPLSAAALDGLFVDMYGTLTTGDRAAVEDTCREIIVTHGLQLTARQLSVAWGERFFHALERCNDDTFCQLLEIEAATLVETMAQLGRDIDPWPFVRRLTEYWRDPPLQPEAAEFVARCGVPICIVSNADCADLTAALERHSLTVHAVLCSEDVGCYKPAPRIFEEALTRTGWRRERVLHVGDSLHSDVAGAQAGGIGAVWINRAHRIHDVGTATADYEFENLLNLLAALDGNAVTGGAGVRRL